MKNKTTRKAYKILPCELFEIDRLIPWLEEQARNGLFLERLSSWGWGRFQKGEPKDLRYWVHTEPDGGPLDQNTFAAYQELGWRRIGHDFPLRFHIFVSEETAAVPLEQEKDGLKTYIQKQNRQLVLELLAFAVLIPFCIYIMFDICGESWRHGWYGKSVAILQGAVYLSIVARGAAYAGSVRRMNRLFQLDDLFLLHREPVNRTSHSRILWWISIAILICCLFVLAAGMLLLIL